MSFLLLSMVSLQPPSLRLTRMKIEAPRFRLSFADDLTDEEWSEVCRALCRIVVEGRPQTPKHRRAVAVRTLLHLFEGPPYRQATRLADRYRAYLSAGWQREKVLEELPDFSSTERRLLHRLGKLNGGRALGWRQLLRDAGPL